MERFTETVLSEGDAKLTITDDESGRMISLTIVAGGKLCTTCDDVLYEVATLIEEYKKHYARKE